MAIALYEHNQIAYDAAVRMLAETGKAAIIHPTGTGKSFISFKLCEDNPEKRSAGCPPRSISIGHSSKTCEPPPTAGSRRIYSFTPTPNSC